MRRKAQVLAAALLVLLVLWLPSRLPAPGYTRLLLADAATGRTIVSAVLPDDERIVLTWTNSLFGSSVTETFHTRAGLLVQDSVTFIDADAPDPVQVSAHDVEDLYHTGGSFTASGLERPFTRIVYRVGEIGNPVMTIGREEVAFKREVGFGGSVELLCRQASVWQWAEAQVAGH